MTNYQRAKKKAIKIEARADSLLGKIQKSPITTLVISVVGLLAAYGFFSLVL